MSLPGPNARRRGRERSERFQAANRAQTRPPAPLPPMARVEQPRSLVQAYHSSVLPKRRLTPGRVALAVALGLVAAAAVSFPFIALFGGR